MNQMSNQKWVSTPVQEERTSWVTLVFPTSCFLRQQIFLNLQYSIFKSKVFLKRCFLKQQIFLSLQYLIFKSKVFPISCFLKQQIFQPLTSSLSIENKHLTKKCEFYKSKAKIFPAWPIRHPSGEEDKSVTWNNTTQLISVFALWYLIYQRTAKGQMQKRQSKEIIDQEAEWEHGDGRQLVVQMHRPLLSSFHMCLPPYHHPHHHHHSHYHHDLHDNNHHHNIYHPYRCQWKCLMFLHFLSRRKGQNPPFSNPHIIIIPNLW